MTHGEFAKRICPVRQVTGVQGRMPRRGWYVKCAGVSPGMCNAPIL